MGRGSLWNEGSLWDEGSLCRFSQQLRAPEPLRVPWGRAVSCAAGEERAQLQPGSAVPCAPPVPSPPRGCAEAALEQRCPGLSLVLSFALCPVSAPRDLNSCHVSTLVLFLLHFPFVLSAVLSQFCVLGCLTSPLFSAGVCSIPVPSCSFILYVFSFVCYFSFVIPFDCLFPL